MKTVLIIHGIGGHAGIHWQQWLGNKLAAQGYRVLMPEMPKSDHPDRKTWLKEVSKTLAEVKLSELIIIGHSLGVATALDFVEQAAGPIGGLLSVSGFAEDYGADLNSYFLCEKTIDFNKVKPKLNWSAVIYGNDDPYVPQSDLKYVADHLGVTPIIVPNGGHLNTEAGYTEFPQLLDVIKNASNKRGSE